MSAISGAGAQGAPQGRALGSWQRGRGSVRGRRVSLGPPTRLPVARLVSGSCGLSPDAPGAPGSRLRPPRALSGRETLLALALPDAGVRAEDGRGGRTLRGAGPVTPPLPLCPQTLQPRHHHQDLLGRKVGAAWAAAPQTHPHSRPGAPEGSQAPAVSCPQSPRRVGWPSCGLRPGWHRPCEGTSGSRKVASAAFVFYSNLVFFFNFMDLFFVCLFNCKGNILKILENRKSVHRPYRCTIPRGYRPPRPAPGVSFHVLSGARQNQRPEKCKCDIFLIFAKNPSPAEEQVEPRSCPLPRASRRWPGPCTPMSAPRGLVRPSPRWNRRTQARADLLCFPSGCIINTPPETACHALHTVTCFSEQRPRGAFPGSTS